MILPSEVLSSGEVNEDESLPAYHGPYLSWFPDGKWLAIVDRASAGEPYGIILLSVETHEKRKLTSAPQKFRGDTSPSVSPDGRALVFSRFVEENIGDLFLLQLSEDLSPNGEPRRLTFENRFAESPAWTPDGRSIVYVVRAKGVDNLWQQSLDGKNRKELTTFAKDLIFRYAYSKDGKQIAIERGNIESDAFLFHDTSK